KLVLVSLAHVALAAVFSKNAAAQSLTVDTTPTGLAIIVDGTNYTALASFNWNVGSPHTLDTASPQLSNDGHSRSVYAMWSDGGTQNHSVTMPAFDTNYVASFSTQYLLETAVAPAGAGTVSNFPSGPWYDAGQ